MNRRRTQTAAIFDLDRTLIAGPSGPAFSSHLGAAGIRQRTCPGADLVAALLPPARRDGDHRADRPPRRQGDGRLAGRRRARRRRGRRRRARWRWSSRTRPASSTSTARPAASLVMATTSPEPLVTPFAERLGFDAVVATRVDRPPTASTPASIDGAAGVGPGQAGGRAGVGRRGRRRPRRLVGLQRQLLRRPAARRRRPPDGRQRRRPPRRPGPPAAAGRCATSTCPRACSRSPAASCRSGPGRCSAPELLANVRLDIAGRREHPGDRAGHRRVQPPQLLRRHRRRRRCSARPAARSASSARRRSSTSRSSAFLSKMAGGIRVNRASGSNEPLEHAIRVLAGRRGRGPGAGGHDPAGPGVLRPRAEGPLGRRPPGPGHPRPGHPRRAVGHREGLAAQPAPAAVRPRASRPPIRVRVGEPVELKHRSLDADTKRIMAALVDQLPDEARVQRTPTEEELRGHVPARLQGRPDARGARAVPAPTPEEGADGRRATATRAALRAADVRRRGVDVERREGPVAEPERGHGRPCSTGRSTSTTSAARSPPPSPPCRACASG